MAKGTHLHASNTDSSVDDRIAGTRAKCHIRVSPQNLPSLRDPLLMVNLNSRSSPGNITRSHGKRVILLVFGDRQYGRTIVQKSMGTNGRNSRRRRRTSDRTMVALFVNFIHPSIHARSLDRSVDRSVGGSPLYAC